MAKTLVYRRTEFVRDYYELEWTENDYQNLLDYLSKETDVNSKTRYEILKDLSFDDICKILNDEEDDIGIYGGSKYTNAPFRKPFNASL